MAERDSKGRFLPGSVGNPKGRPKTEPTPDEMRQAILPEALIVLHNLMRSDDETIAFQAVKTFLEWDVELCRIEVEEFRTHHDALFR